MTSSDVSDSHVMRHGILPQYRLVTRFEIWGTSPNCEHVYILQILGMYQRQSSPQSQLSQHATICKTWYRRSKKVINTPAEATSSTKWYNSLSWRDKYHIVWFCVVYFGEVIMIIYYAVRLEGDQTHTPQFFNNKFHFHTDSAIFYIKNHAFSYRQYF
jgi:hypothetical protein